ncbi:hypothetical protein GR223_01375 [Rhizobium leguminosarum]|uniref:thermonuclease family protein n=1 Tax=Rhizobium ruizarguesonis TaxID=2081791 RepID=UPI0013DEABF1|nr:thermonuclease family protein [Rhizobium ruizarguesonis]NEJ84612.1 hypothetical protein [Rhizobium ruizarguesonis]
MNIGILAYGSLIGDPSGKIQDPTEENCRNSIDNRLTSNKWHVKDYVPVEGVPFVSGIDTPEIGSHAKCLKERKLALMAKGRLKELLAERGLKVVFSGAVDKTPTHRPLVNIYRPNGEEIGKKLLKEGFARTWEPKQRNDWCS